MEKPWDLLNKLKIAASHIETTIMGLDYETDDAQLMFVYIKLNEVHQDLIKRIKLLEDQLNESGL